MNAIYDAERTTLAPRGEAPTAAYAWASSPLGGPSDSAGGLPYGDDFATIRIAPAGIAPAARRRPIDKGIVAAGVIGLIIAGTALAVALFSGSPEPQHVAVTSGSTSAPAAATPAPMVAAPDNGPAPATVVNPADDHPVPADAGSPPDAAPPVVVWAPVAPRQLPPPPSLPPFHSLPKLPAPPQLTPPPGLPALCLPPHHLVQGVCK
jgi:hypothetical protein